MKNEQSLRILFLNSFQRERQVTTSTTFKAAVVRLCRSPSIIRQLKQQMSDCGSRMIQCKKSAAPSRHSYELALLRFSCSIAEQ